MRGDKSYIALKPRY